MAATWEPGPARPPHPASEIHLWRGEGQREAARAALAEVLSRYLGLEPAKIALERGEHGKPALPGDPPPLEFNLSHSAGLVLIAVTAGRPVGVDVEASGRERNFLALAARILPADSAAQVRAAAPDRRRSVFYAAWASYEAAVKCGGGGIAGGPVEAPLASAAVDVGPGFAAAVAVAGPVVPLLRRYLLP